MRTKDLMELVGNPDFISGIYNYCDRWCERCPLTSRCMVYASEKEDEDSDPASRDINNAAFWQKLTSIFEQTREMIAAWAEENGVDLNDADAEAAIEEHDREMQDAQNHELAQAAENYAWQVSKWFEEELGMQTSDDSGAEAAALSSEHDDSIDEATEVIRWYQFQIAAKTVRALMSQDDEDEDEEELGDLLLKHSDGSIKVALIAMDRSVSAWRVMQIGLPDKADSILPLLVALEGLRQSTERAFPNARDFIRPGFDEVSPDLIQ
ncbi:MAG: hypothetical protein JWM21_1846 [Acidobacteria bacterium]|nr:hypothetical protein [Acidobacteriota bacterium]